MVYCYHINTEYNNYTLFTQTCHVFKYFQKTAQQQLNKCCDFKLFAANKSSYCAYHRPIHLKN